MRNKFFLINVLLLFLTLFLGVLGSDFFLVIFMNRFDNGFFSFFKNFTYLVTIMAIFYFIQKWFVKNKLLFFFIASIVVFSISLIFTPAIINLSGEIGEKLNVISTERQNELFQNIEEEIHKNKLPYNINFALSEETTKKEGNVFSIVLIKTNQSTINKNEIEMILDLIPKLNSKFQLIFYDYENKLFISLIFDNQKTFIDCAPFSKCKEIKYK
ncbi:hypothetical protein DMN77_04770 [Paenibacillus sp. 79R4]|uniref:hypothetical protein n=1 Tax=Paenibacillus sp. 79R4 TaxID=2212847 RepID=UPI0015BC144E|nr:hypothetical protein [Paenibacillus sp. 79R4]NWL86911.1 hypothetical protein [Paenibacillus sp. 79R4]